MAKNGFKVMDSDMHVMEPTDLWQKYTDSNFRDRAPKGFTRWHGDTRIELEGFLLPDPRNDWTQGKQAEQEDIYRDSFEG